MTASKRAFRVGDIVEVPSYAQDRSMSHFNSGRGILLYNYRQLYGGGPSGRHEWGVHFDKSGTSAWHPDHRFKLIKAADEKMELKAYRLRDKDDRDE